MFEDWTWKDTLETVLSIVVSAATTVLMIWLLKAGA